MRCLYLPIEVAKRELDAKLLLALTSLEKDLFDEVYVGRGTELFERMGRPGVVLLKSAASFELSKIKKLKRAGHIVYSLDEEGIVPPLNDPSLNARFSSQNLKQLDGLLLNGPLEFLSLPDAVRSAENIVVVGNPRFDFYKPKYRGFYNQIKNQIHAEYGDKKILLIASRFGDVNIHDGIDCYALLKSLGYINSPAAELFFEGFYKHTNRLFDHFLKLPNFLARKFPEHLIVVRPHPSESYTKWVENCTEKNIVVTSKYDIASWLVSSECLIHNGCTTAVEAVAMDVPVITYMPVTSSEYDLNYSNEVGRIADTLDEVANFLNLLPRWKLPSGNRAISTIIDFDSEVNSSTKIVEQLSRKAPNSILGTRVAGVRSASLLIFYMKLISIYLLNFVGVFRSYSLKKYPFLSLRGYKSKINAIQRSFGMNFEVRFKKVGLDIIKITRT